MKKMIRVIRTIIDEAEAALLVVFSMLMICEYAEPGFFRFFMRIDVIAVILVLMTAIGAMIDVAKRISDIRRKISQPLH